MRRTRVKRALTKVELGVAGKMVEVSQRRLVVEGGCVRRKWANFDVGRQLMTRMRKRSWWERWGMVKKSSRIVLYLARALERKEGSVEVVPMGMPASL